MRYYDRFGRWTQQNPVPSANPYVYADDDPVNGVDPSGRITCGAARFLFYAGAAFLAGGTIAGVVATGGV